jgi:hypothetical protein
MSLHVVVMMLALGTTPGGTSTPPVQPAIIIGSPWLDVRGVDPARWITRFLGPDSAAAIAPRSNASQGLVGFRWAHPPTQSVRTELTPLGHSYPSRTTCAEASDWSPLEGMPVRASWRGGVHTTAVRSTERVRSEPDPRAPSVGTHASPRSVRGERRRMSAPVRWSRPPRRRHRRRPLSEQ